RTAHFSTTESESERRGSQEGKCLFSVSVSARSRVSSRKKSNYTHLSKEQEHRSRERLDEVKERHHYEEKLQDLKLKTLKREMQIRRELEIRQAERDLESCSIAKSSSSSSKNSSNPQSVADQSLKEKQLPRQVNVQLPVYSSDCNKINKKFTTTFKAVVDKQPYEPEPIVKFAILEKYLTGPAKDFIRGFPFTENSYPLALKALQDRFGDEEDQASFYLGAVENLPKIKISDVPGLRKFYDDLNTNIQVLENMGPDVAMHLNDPRRMKLLSTKLPRNLAVAWATYQDDKGIGSDMRAFAEWLRKKVQILERVEVQPHIEAGDKRVPGKQVFKPHVHVTTRDEVTQTERTETKLPIERGTCWVCRDGNRWPGQCLVLKKMTVYERKQLVKQNRACFKCLLRGNLVAKCRRKVGCLIENCKGTRHTLLHQENPKDPAISTHKVERKSSETSGGEQLARNEETPTKETLSVTSNANRSCPKRKIVALPVKKIDILNGYGQRVTLNCLDDSGSQVRLITHRLVESLGLTTRRSNRLTLSCVGDQNIKLNSEVSFLIQVKDNELSIPITAYAIPNISNYSPPFDIEEIKQKFPYLQDVDVIVDTENVDLLVGQDYPILRRQLKTRYGKPDEPYAVRTVLGWGICVPVDERVGEDPSTHLISSCSPPTTSVGDFNLKRFWEIEQMPVKEPSLYTNKQQKILEETEDIVWTKRGVLRRLAQLFDPMGLLAAFLVRAKITIPRHVWAELEEVDMELHLFADASQRDMAAVAYVKCQRNNEVKVSLLMSKTQVAPLKKMSIPRLELQVCLMAVRLAEFIVKQMEFKTVKVVFWSDSTVALLWIKMESCVLKEFVANRVATIQEKTEGCQWHHVSGQDNPADLASRGVDLRELLKPDDIWFSGPKFRRNLKVEDFSTFHKLRKRVAFFRRPFRNWRLKKSKRLTKPTTRSAMKKKDIQHPIKPLSADELREAEIWLLRRDQSICFAKEITVLEKQQTGLGKTKTRKMLVPKSSPLYSLSPFMDDEGLVRLGGRLERSPLSYDCRHPIILGKGSHLAALLIRRSHEEVKHFGVNTVLCNLRQRYWPIRGREQVKKILSSCVLCKKWRGNPGVQFMADLPASRVDFPNPPFTLTGVDYFGPITTKAGFRGGRREKRYGVVFTCLQTRAVHLEVAQSLSTDDFLKVFSRFVARRSKPKRMFSDQGTNFVGAEREMRQLVKELCNDVVLKTKLQQEALDWNFNPPFAPHMGGAREAMVKLAKRQLMPLLPSEIQVDEVSPKRRWLFLQSIMSKIWKRWQKEYLPCLQRRPKWNQTVRNLEPGDLVLILDPNQPRGRWLRGKIEETFPDDRNVVRSAKVLTQNGVLHRPVTKLILLLREH
ncbi:PREDICTED: uncharacterized protein LOC102806687, partial [Paramuricea clavata]